MYATIIMSIIESSLKRSCGMCYKYYDGKYTIQRSNDILHSLYLSLVNIDGLNDKIEVHVLFAIVFILIATIPLVKICCRFR